MNESARKIFVAYPFTLYKENLKIDGEYRMVFKDLEKLFDVRFCFADERIADLHILKKIEQIICSSDFGIYDITGRNFNVGIEMGLALGLKRSVYIAFQPSTISSKKEEPPSDLAGIDRIQFNCIGELHRKLLILLQERYHLKGRLLKADDYLWSPRGWPDPTPSEYAGALRDVRIYLVEEDSKHPERMVVDLSLQTHAGAWRSKGYNSAPWVHIDFLDKNNEVVEVRGSCNWDIAEFHTNKSNYLRKQKILVSDRWSDVVAVNVWTGAGYAWATSPYWYRNLSFFMILARFKQFVSLSRRHLKKVFSHTPTTEI